MSTLQNMLMSRIGARFNISLPNLAMKKALRDRKRRVVKRFEDAEENKNAGKMENNGHEFGDCGQNFSKELPGTSTSLEQLKEEKNEKTFETDKACGDAVSAVMEREPSYDLLDQLQAEIHHWKMKYLDLQQQFHEFKIAKAEEKVLKFNAKVAPLLNSESTMKSVSTQTLEPAAVGKRKLFKNQKDLLFNSTLSRDPSQAVGKEKIENGKFTAACSTIDLNSSSISTQVEKSELLELRFLAREHNEKLSLKDDQIQILFEALHLAEKQNKQNEKQIKELLSMVRIHVTDLRLNNGTLDVASEEIAKIRVSLKHWKQRENDLRETLRTEVASLEKVIHEQSMLRQDFENKLELENAASNDLLEKLNQEKEKVEKKLHRETSLRQKFEINLQSQEETTRQFVEKMEKEKLKLQQLLFEETFLRKEIETILRNKGITYEEQIKKIKEENEDLKEALELEEFLKLESQAFRESDNEENKALVEKLRKEKALVEKELYCEKHLKKELECFLKNLLKSNARTK